LEVGRISGPNFVLDFLARSQPDTLQDCLLQAELGKNHFTEPLDYILFEKISRAGRDLLYFRPTPAIFSL
jgi:hypothetical protein